MTVIAATIGGITLEQPVSDSAELGWRWWRRSMYELGFADERCITLGHVDLRHLDIAGDFLLVAMERDGLLDLASPFSLFPVVDNVAAQAGVEEFAARVIRDNAVQRTLF